MKATELQIGDWYLASEEYRDCYGKYNLGFYPKKLTIDDLIFAKNNDWDESDWDEFTKPIPLTSEILKLNGFLIKKIKCELQIDDYTSIELYQDGVLYISKQLPNIGRIQIEIKFVHELQHALRLCGLNNLAENFKIE